MDRRPLIQGLVKLIFEHKSSRRVHQVGGQLVSALRQLDSIAYKAVGRQRLRCSCILHSERYIVRGTASKVAVSGHCADSATGGGGSPGTSTRVKQHWRVVSPALRAAAMCLSHAE